MIDWGSVASHGLAAFGGAVFGIGLLLIWVYWPGCPDEDVNRAIGGRPVMMPAGTTITIRYGDQVETVEPGDRIWLEGRENGPPALKVEPKGAA